MPTTGTNLYLAKLFPWSLFFGHIYVVTHPFSGFVFLRHPKLPHNIDSLFRRWASQCLMHLPQFALKGLYMLALLRAYQDLEQWPSELLACIQGEKRSSSREMPACGMLGQHKRSRWASHHWGPTSPADLPQHSPSTDISSTLPALCAGRGSHPY